MLQNSATARRFPAVAAPLNKLPLIHISIATSTGALAPLSPPNSGGRPEFEVPQNWGIEGAKPLAAVSQKLMYKR